MKSKRSFIHQPTNTILIKMTLSYSSFYWQEANKKFLLVKEAYEAIKMKKGLMNPQGYVYDSDTTSMRPDPSKFMSDDE